MFFGNSIVILNPAVLTKTMSIDNTTLKQSFHSKTVYEYQVNLQMTLTKEETIGLQAIFVK